MKGVRNLAIFALSLAFAVPALGAEHELQWDNGVFRIAVHYQYGEGTWAGLDFDTSTLKTSNWRLKRVRANLGWTGNERWDGMRLAIFDMAGGKPGKIIWPKTGTPKLVMPYGTPRLICTWCEFGVGYDLPAPKFVVALEQYLDHPNCDSYGLGYGRGFAEKHTWLKYRNTKWELTGMGVWMLRAVVAGPTNIGVSPTSLGRVKALYY
ncbi:MAG: hypothetical protein JSU81_09100 [Candidatus Coatesbacteria bacterium]|nr:MAG: hypothetical protein JSU81_09100 [Candidatus Coatesbacteria bacterium]